MADVLKAEDVLGARESEDAKDGITTLLSEIIDHESARWDTCCELAACAVAGCLWDSSTDAIGDVEDNDRTSRVEAQCGNLVVLAPW